MAHLVLLYARMKRLVLTATMVAALSGVASAGTYVGLGIGTGPALSTDRSNGFESDGRSGKLLLGSRWGRFSIEGSVANFDMLTVNAKPYDVWQAAIAGKLNLPLSDGFEAFGRVGLQKTWASFEPNEIYDVSGSGYLLGGGIEYVIPTAATRLSIWIDYQYSEADLDGEREKYELSARMWTLGATIGF